MGEAEIARFLSSLASDRHVSASTQNQAFNALLFLYKEVVNKKIGLIEGVVRAKRPVRLPVVLTKNEVRKVIDHMNGVPRLMAMLLYGGGLRLMECCHLRVKDIDFSRDQIVVRAGKGDKDRHTMLPTSIKESLSRHIEAVRCQHQEDIEKGLDALRCRTPLIASIRTPTKSGDGNGYFRLPVTMSTESAGKNAGIIFMSLCYSER